MSPIAGTASRGQAAEKNPWFSLPASLPHIRLRLRIVIQPIEFSPDLTTAFLLAAGAAFLSGLSIFGLWTR